MELICESNAFDPYLHESNEVDYSNPIVKEKVSELFKPSQTEIEKVKIAFEYVRDDISHSWDIQGTQVTCKRGKVFAMQNQIYLRLYYALKAYQQGFAIND